MFIDRAKIWVRGGDGGNGCVSFLREKFIPRGGPNGGDGGNGGDVVIRAGQQTSTLNSFHHQQHFRADTGRHGEGRNRHGRQGEGCVITVPVGTVVFDHEGGGVMADLQHAGDELVVAHGGRGGRGNARFATSVQQAPRTAEPGQEGEERWIRLELRVLADVGLVGFPNVGKSTLLSRVTSARPKVASYPFTTLSPHLGVLDLDESRSVVLADIPGLIRGAHSGAGLGDRFLQHLRRTRVLVHLVDAAEQEGRGPLDDYLAIRHELQSYGGGLGERPEIVALSRSDLGNHPDADALGDHLEEQGRPRPFALSAVTGDGLDDLRRAITACLDQTPPLPDVEEDTEPGEVILTLREKR